MIPYSRSKLSDFCTLSQTKLLENHTLYSCANPYSLYKREYLPWGKVAGNCYTYLLTWKLVFKLLHFSFCVMNDSLCLVHCLCQILETQPVTSDKLQLCALTALAAGFETSKPQKPLLLHFSLKINAQAMYCKLTFNPFSPRVNYGDM